MPNTCSTPSALRHSMMASTARMLLPPASVGRTSDGTRAFPGHLEAHSALEQPFLLRWRGPRGLGLGEVEVAPAAHAHLVLDRHEAAALGAAAEHRFALEAHDQRRQRAEERKAEPDDEPDEEGGALYLRDDVRGQAKEEEDYEQLQPGLFRGFGRAPAVPIKRRRPPARPRLS